MIFFTDLQLRWQGGLLVLWLLIAYSAPAQNTPPTKRWDITLGGAEHESLEQVQQTLDGGYLLGGTSSSGLSADKTQARPGLWLVKLNENGQKQWDWVFGPAGGASLDDMQQTADGGYVLAGTSNAGVSGDKSEPGRGGYDYWIIRLDAQGRKLWDRTLGGDDYDVLMAMRQTSDGGFVLGGRSYSGQSGDKSEPGRGSLDYWVVKLDAQGRKQWDRTLGGAQREEFTCLEVTTDGGCIVGGFSLSGVGADKSQPIRGSVDYWVVKLSASGTKQWDRTVGGDLTDVLTKMRQTPDGGYLLAGFSESKRSGERTEPKLGWGSDYWIVKLDATGAKQWDSTIGSSGHDELRALALTADGGYLLGGASVGNVSGHKTQPAMGFQDWWVVKLDGRGRKQWDRTYGGTRADELYSMQQTADLGFILAGSSDSGISADKSQPGRGGFDFWALRLNPTPPASGAPRAEIRGDSVLCQEPLLLTATSSVPAVGYRWSTGATTASIRPTQQGTYSVEVRFADGRTATDQQLVSLLTADVRITGDTTLCPGTRAQLVAAAPYATGYYWSTGDSTARISINQPGNYTVTAYFGTTCSASRQVVVRGPSAAIAGPTLLCPGTSATLTAVAPGASALRWSTGVTAPTLTITQAGTYRLEASFANGCVLTSTHTVAAGATVAAISGDSLFCPGGSVQLTAVAAGATGYRWSTGATTPTLTVTQPGWYAVEASYSNGCRTTARMRVRQLPPPVAFGLGRDTTICADEPLTLRAPTHFGPDAAYLWSDGSRGPELRVTQSGAYTLQVTTACGTVSASRKITVTDCALLANVITPNGDQHNDRWVLHHLPPGRYILEVFNRWGQRVYHSADYRNDWGPEAAAGTYYYKLRHTITQQVYQGWVEVLR